MKLATLFLCGLSLVSGCGDARRDAVITDIELFSLQHSYCQPTHNGDPCAKLKALEQKIEDYIRPEPVDSRDYKLLSEFSSTLRVYMILVDIRQKNYEARYAHGLPWSDEDNAPLKQKGAESVAEAAHIARLLRTR